jgi:2'-5' RNA ligase
MSSDAPPSSAARLFVGLWPDEAVRSALHAHQQAWQWPRGAGLVRRDRLHVTLHFLGDVASDRIPALHQALRGVKACAFDQPFGQARRWHGGLAVLEMEPVPALMALHLAVGEALAALGHAPERRPYRPHLTLARRAEGAVPPPAPLVIPWRVRGFVLVESELAPPARYAVRADCPLVDGPLAP